MKIEPLFEKFEVREMLEKYEDGVDCIYLRVDDFMMAWADL